MNELIHFLNAMISCPVVLSIIFIFAVIGVIGALFDIEFFYVLGLAVVVPIVISMAVPMFIIAVNILYRSV